ncbi:bifunctional proline dehydrogenase/L-glutamate gamma-semialdehyde dehydrogenase PutA [Granulibacter bethesdensis]|uniref:bifunctional proline dehydrogenase/L-glutamate gamma-semialdehyde dehydrogenase PutA n=1 Tax=Granulibacter bethesdensis TaxID=364410 RepID=UPI0003F1F3C8|nr:bifunctional proline dehydrogenase/L-glutamate gamma-semialdehyde dehydrogenase PutA [Granulibacter bethesdensis]AHJ64477.1 Delta-1-pyrroline-5-carboxylate dehydrogenase [Granulibacter bethesdensis CGDNIH4]
MIQHGGLAMTRSGLFIDLAQAFGTVTEARHRLDRACRRPEQDCVASLLPLASLSDHAASQADTLARLLAERLREHGPGNGLPTLIQEYDLSSQEGVALMCLAEALLRIPDDGTRDALIRDKIGRGEWHTHLGWTRPLFVNAATWSLVLTGRLVAPSSASTLGAALTRLIGRAGEPVIRHAMDRVVRLLGTRFVAGETIEAALAVTSRLWTQGFRHSYDMLGEAAMTRADADRYYRAYEHAIDCIGATLRARGYEPAEDMAPLIEAPSISIKLSALHPRYEHTQHARIMQDLPPLLRNLAAMARANGIALTIDAEEADRLPLSLDVLAALCADPVVAGWNGIGLAVQAYQRRAPAVIENLIDLARHHGRRIMVRLVKGAYWDSEIKRAQIDGLESFPVFTRKSYTDLSYVACARMLLEAPDAVFPQFATHNARTVATIIAMAEEITGVSFNPDQYEFQCLYGMGEALYTDVVRFDGLNRPCRIYAPVGTHETLLAYLVRRLLENGANTSFINRVSDTTISIDQLIADPVQQILAMRTECGTPHPTIRSPRILYGPERENAWGIDLTDATRMAQLAEACITLSSKRWLVSIEEDVDRERISIRNPAASWDHIGDVVFATAEEVDRAIARARQAAPLWAAELPSRRAACLREAADAMERDVALFISLAVREAGKTIPNAIGEVREAVDFLRYYAAGIENGWNTQTHLPLGVVTCISPWNFPLAIFTGQVAAALAAGNAVLAKPAEQTPLIAAEAVAVLHRAGVPTAVLQLVPGDGAVGARLVADSRIDGVVFTGSTEAARSIQRSLSYRLNTHGDPVPLIAETGGQNAMIVDSTALPEQVVSDVLVSAFDSAGQRCSALRVLCLQDDIADLVITMLRGALQERVTARPDRLDTDIGPVISAAARDAIEDHIAAMARAGCTVHRAALRQETEDGFFVSPTIIELGSHPIPDKEVFGPVLHVLRFRRDDLSDVIARVNATGYALTFGIHSRIQKTVDYACMKSTAGNIYVNRSIIGAVVGVQPFGGHGLSGTGPKAGGPLYLSRLVAHAPPLPTPVKQVFIEKEENAVPVLVKVWQAWIKQQGIEPLSLLILRYDRDMVLPGPVGEQNIYRLSPRSTLLCIASDLEGLSYLVQSALAAGIKHIAVSIPADITGVFNTLPDALRSTVVLAASDQEGNADAVLFEGDDSALIALQTRLAHQSGRIVPVYRIRRQGGDIPLLALVAECTISINTAAAGGNAALMAMA